MRRMESSESTEKTSAADEDHPVWSKAPELESKDIVWGLFSKEQRI